MARKKKTTKKSSKKKTPRVPAAVAAPVPAAVPFPAVAAPVPAVVPAPAVPPAQEIDHGLEPHQVNRLRMLGLQVDNHHLTPVEKEQKKATLARELAYLLFGRGSFQQMETRFHHCHAKRQQIKRVLAGPAEVLQPMVLSNLENGLKVYEKEIGTHIFIFEKMVEFALLGGEPFANEHKEDVQYFDDGWVGLCNTNVNIFLE